ncbi:glutamic acid-rich protein isoform X1 [Harmonia axyridis]|uniref:glutamic acid-rich protein isoform X1 n=1 Tax=Harmonia axyridis TaxID=115357 RepID=UPI001E279D68|nr:glutamic acid-rich protein isoform X1 [Harmonia axyridis]XP_045468897.1 glutamic acid-rich protein isoform X1 [Harmonia axyridis]
MPAGAGERKKSDANTTQPRETFRPPWVKDGPSPLPMPNAPWKSKNVRRDSNTSDGKPENPLANVQLRKTSIPNKEAPENGTKDVTFVKPPLKPVPPREVSPKPKEKLKFDVKLNSVEERIKKEPPRRTPTVESELDREIPALRNKLVREESLRRLSQTPPAPPLPPPPPPSMPPDFKRDPLSREKLEKLETLRARPKTRPDWTNMLKEIESKKALKHVQCNDRSTPILPRCKSQSKTGEHFLYESEKAQQSTVHNELLQQIQQGVALKKVKTNDRSKPQLEGLRKFRRQMTIEEQIQKSVSMASIPPFSTENELQEEIPDEMDDIDKVRDDLQSTKQMLAFELRNKEAQIRENKRLMTRLQTLEMELEKERAKNRENGGTGVTSETAEKQIKSLQQEADQARKVKDEMEKKYHETSDHLENTKAELEDVKKEKLELEKRLQDILQVNGSYINWSYGIINGGKRGSLARQTSIANGEESVEEEEPESSEESENDDEETKQRKQEKHIKLLTNKLRNYKNKEDNAKKERVALREIIKKHQIAIREERKKYRVLQKEVNKMAALMKDDESEEGEDEEEKEESEEETEEEESSEESESEESCDDSASEKSMSEPEDAPPNKRKENYSSRVKRHESILAALKKGNNMLKTNAERLQDDLNKQKEQTASLQDDLDSVLSELG